MRTDAAFGCGTLTSTRSRSTCAMRKSSESCAAAPPAVPMSAPTSTLRAVTMPSNGARSSS